MEHRLPTRAKGTLLLAAGLAAAWLSPAAALAAAPYDGGTGNGWAFSAEQAFFVGAGMVTVSGDQHFQSGGGSTPLHDVSFGFGNGVLPTVASNLAISIPAGFPGVFDSTVTSVTASGPAAARISGAVAYANGNRTALIGLASNTVDGDQLTLSGLSVSVLSGSTPVPSYLTADTNADGTADLTDTAAIFVDAVAQTRSGDAASVYGGGTKDGWDWVANAAATVSGPSGTGTAVSVAAGSSWWNDDGFGGSAPVADWEFDDHAGSTVADKSGGGNNGTWHGTGTAHWAQGKIGSAGKFNGSDDYVDLGSTLFQSVTTGFSGSLWINHVNGVSDDDPIGNMTYATPNTGFRIYGGSNNVFRFFGSTGDISFGTIGSGWTHLAWSYDISSGNLTTYVNGNKVATGPVTFNTATSNLRLGRGCLSCQWFSGKIDSVKLYKYARTPAQVADDYDRGAPVGWWKFDECTGTTLHDGSGNGFTGTLSLGASGQTSAGTCTASANTAWYNGANGKFNSSLNFDGADDYVTTSSGSVLNPTGELSVSAWVYPTATTSGSAVVSRWLSATANRAYWLGITNGKFRFSLNGNNYIVDGTTSVSTGQWYHVVGTWSAAAGVTLYVNGKNENGAVTGSNPATVTAVSATTLVGAEQGGTGDTVRGFFPGKIDDVRVYNYALSQSQVEKVMNYDGSLTVEPGSGQP